MKHTFTALVTIMMIAGLGGALGAAENTASPAGAAEAAAALPGWSEFLPVDGQIPQARKITLSYPVQFMTAADSTDAGTESVGEASGEANDAAGGNADGAANDAPYSADTADSSSSAASSRPPLIRHEIQYPTIYSGPRRPTHTSFEKLVFEANLIYMVGINAADYFTTRAALKHEGLMEANPMMQPFVKNEALFGAVKLGLTMGSYVIMKSLFKKNKPLAWVASIAANAALSYVVVNNLRMIDRAQAGPGGVCR